MIIDPWKSVDKILELNNEWVFITGGEPLLVDDIMNICDALRTKKRVGLTTNGTINKFEIASHVDRLGVSIDGPKDIHEMSRGEGTWDKAIAFLTSAVGITETVIMTTVLRGSGQDMQIKGSKDIQQIVGCDHIQFTYAG